MKNVFERYRRYHHYVVVRQELERLSDEALRDAGVKRYQLGHVARVRALKR